MTNRLDSDSMAQIAEIDTSKKEPSQFSWDQHVSDCERAELLWLPL
jgi:hypothetical protein